MSNTSRFIHRFRLSALASVSLLACSGWAQSNGTLAPVVVTANPLGATELIAPVDQLNAAELLQRRQTTLGEMLNGLPGVSSTYFGPNASRPVIRGLDGDRITILNNGVGNLDLSSISPDHAVTLDPLLIERVEVLRGPGVLQYGGSAVGGVVNVIDGRIHRERMFGAQGGVSGRLDAGLATGNKEQGGAVVLDGGNDRFSLHVDAMSRKTEDVAVPIDLDCTKPGAPSRARRICNSASETYGGAVGGTMHFDRGYLGASLSTYDTKYGTVAEDEVTIRMRSNQFALEGELRDLGPVWQSVRAKFNRTDYQHTEFEGATAGTFFKTTGNDLRLEARHARIGRLDGVLGLQLDDSRFSADGAEAYAPYSRTRSSAAFLHEELGTTWGKLSAGARVESVRVESFGIAGNATFTPGSRSFNPASYALGALWNVAPEWQLTSNVSLNERAPRAVELYANGEHKATNAKEIGDPNLSMERSANVDVGAAWKRGAHRARVQVFQHRFSNYISLEGTNLGASPPEYTFTQVRASFVGAEANGNVRLIDAQHKLDLLMRADTVRAENTSTGQPLPRIAPHRVGATLQWGHAGWSARLGVDAYAGQDRVPSGQKTTGGYALWNAGLSLRDKVGGLPALWYARLDNIGDKLAYSSTSFLTQTTSGKAPLPGRSLRVGLQLTF